VRDSCDAALLLLCSSALSVAVLWSGVFSVKLLLCCGAPLALLLPKVHLPWRCCGAAVV
jgi:hypothetical protein